jgi:RNA polymerase sigma-70 factor (ECF subfamily)
LLVTTCESTAAEIRPIDRPLRARVQCSSQCSSQCASLCTEAGLADAYRSHATEIAAFCRRALTDGWLAEEVMQEVFLKAWRHCDRFDGRESLADAPVQERLRMWLFAIARNAVIDAARRRGRRPRLVAHPEPPDQGDPVDGYARFDDADLLRTGLAALSPAHRASVVAIYLDGLTYEQAGVRLGIPAGTVKSRVFAALRSLRDALDARSAAS